MMTVQNLSEGLQRKILHDVYVGGNSCDEVADIYGVSLDSLYVFLQKQVADRLPSLDNEDTGIESFIHNKVVRRWVLQPLYTAIVAYIGVVFVQSFFAGFEAQIVKDSLAFITQPLAKVVFAAIALSSIIICLNIFCPILVVFLNEKVNTVSLKETFLKSSPEAKLYFLAAMFGSFCFLFGQIFH